MRDYVLGVMGGMGPAATADFLSKLTYLNPARRDQEHVRSITCSFPDIPDRTDAILSNGPSPLPAMRQCLSILKLYAVTHIAIPCNTAHCWFDQLQRETETPIVHIVDAVRNALAERHALDTPVGLLATTATIRAGVYEERLAKHHVRCIVPEEPAQTRVMNVIRSVKARDGGPNNTKELMSIVAGLKHRGARVIILGCTELPLALTSMGPDFIDSTAALAMECLRLSRSST